MEYVLERERRGKSFGRFWGRARKESTPLDFKPILIFIKEYVIWAIPSVEFFLAQDDSGGSHAQRCRPVAALRQIQTISIFNPSLILRSG
ncbi:hypothetical protein L6452_00759 [Arctium lappa]|uniref:Uncharacterized protein n=1 Tax=Arctium lappa TaxID=4217 RepID=A0ACB9FEU3_ARCLA|nr:hypothetical protein L6452_00759 [Arctium lappa]